MMPANPAGYAGDLRDRRRALSMSTASFVSPDGIYCLVLRLPRARRIAVAGRSDWRFPAGWYIYVGSAKRNLPARLARHVCRVKTLHWHIDRLRPLARISEIWVRGWLPGAECETGAMLRRLPGAAVPCRGFGASDCQCEAHLIHLPNRPATLGGDWALRFRVRGARLIAIPEVAASAARDHPAEPADSLGTARGAGEQSSDGV
jgi:Uri superfamily endonuclease